MLRLKPPLSLMLSPGPEGVGSHQWPAAAFASIHSAVLIDEHFSERMLARVWMISAVLCIVAGVAMWVRIDVFHAASFLLGGVVAILNLRWLEYSVRRMLDAQEGRVKGKRLWPKMVARYAFLGAIAYVIFKGYLLSVSAFLAGLFVPVAALMLEAVYELVAALRS
jgi:hypothetical protein